MNAVVQVSPGGAVTTAATASDIKAQVQRVQQVMQAVMKDKTHYGVVPGTPKPSLWKPGAEVLCATFHIAPSYRTDDLSDSDCIRYRVTCIGTHQATGIVLGEGMGECSSNEEKYKWRAAVCDEEFAETDDSRKRSKWKRGERSNYKQNQIRTEPADIANTVLKMACKRAQIAMTLNVCAASDIFTQDLEDLPEGVDPEEGGGQPSAPRGKPATAAPKATSQQAPGIATEKQLGLVRKKLDDAGMSAEQLCQHLQIPSLDKLPFAKVNEALAYIKDPERAAIQEQ